MCHLQTAVLGFRFITIFRLNVNMKFTHNLMRVCSIFCSIAFVVLQVIILLHFCRYAKDVV